VNDNNNVNSCDNQHCTYDDQCEQHQKCCPAAGGCGKVCIGTESNSEGHCTVKNNLYPVGTTLKPTDPQLDERCNYCECKSNEQLFCTSLETCFKTEQTGTETTVSGPGGQSGSGIPIISSLPILMLSLLLGIACMQLATVI
jgi:hypothetical protein